MSSLESSATRFEWCRASPNPGPDVESEIWESKSHRRRRGSPPLGWGAVRVVLSRVGPQEGCWAGLGRHLSRSLSRQVNGLKNKGSLVIQPLREIDIFFWQTDEWMEWRHRLDHLHLLEEQRGREKKMTEGERKERNFVARSRSQGWLA